MTTRITIRKPDDWHLHVRDGEMLKAVMPYTAKHFGRAILMPNLIPPGRRGRILRGSLRSHLRVTEQIAERV